MKRIQLKIKTTDSQLAVYGDKCTLHIRSHLRDKFMACLDTENSISYDDWCKWLSR